MYNFEREGGIVFYKIYKTVFYICSHFHAWGFFFFSEKSQGRLSQRETNPNYSLLHINHWLYLYTSSGIRTHRKAGCKMPTLPPPPPSCTPDMHKMHIGGKLHFFFFRNIDIYIISLAQSGAELLRSKAKTSGLHYTVNRFCYFPSIYHITLTVLKKKLNFSANFQ